MQRFPSTLDKTSYIVSYSFIALSALIYASSWFAWKKAGDDTGVLLLTLLTPTLLAIIFVAMYILSPRAIEVSEQEIKIDRKVSPIVISFARITNVQRMDDNDMKFAIRTFGNGGVFGYTGYFYNRKMGSMQWHCTRRTGYVLIATTDKKKIIITPDDPDALIQYVQQLHPEKVSA